MKILFLHGVGSQPGGLKPTYLAQHGHDVSNPQLSDDDFLESIRIAQSAYDKYCPDVIVGSSRGGGVAVNIESNDTPLVLLCPSWKNKRMANKVKPNTVILHSRQDQVIPFSQSEELLINSELSPDLIIEVGFEHRLADEHSLRAMLHACEQMAGDGQVNGP
jgi:hypothetical protein